MKCMEIRPAFMPGRKARSAVELAREQVAQWIQAKPNQIVFTSGGTEANNLALFGMASTSKHLITTSIEHPAILKPCQRLAEQGMDVTYLPVDEVGKVQLDPYRQALEKGASFVTIAMGNSEVGTLQPIQALAALAREKGIVFHTDAVQAASTEAINVTSWGVDLLTLSGHKIYGPKGIGALYIADQVSVRPQQLGGLQERLRRGGTENVPAIVGLGKAAEIALKTREAHRQEMRMLRERLLAALTNQDVSYVINGDSEGGLPHIVNISFPGADTETMVMRLDLAGIACSSGSACHSGVTQSSHVLEAMKISPERKMSAVRFSLGRGNTAAEMEKVATEIKQIVTVEGDLK